MAIFTMHQSSHSRREHTYGFAHRPLVHVTVIVPPLGVWHERDLPLGSFLQPLSSHCFHSRPSAYHPVIISRGSRPSAGTWRAIWLPAPSLQDSLGSHSLGPWR